MALFPLFRAFHDDWLDFPLRSTTTSHSSPQQLQAFVPRVDVVEHENEYQISAELPGMDKADVQLKLEGEFLTINGTKKSEVTEENPEKRYRRIERSYGSFTRQFRLPDNVDRGGIDARFDNGVLRISLKKMVKEEKSTQIEIH